MEGEMCRSSPLPPCSCHSLCTLPLIAVSQRERQTLLTRWWHQKVLSDSLSLTGLLCLNTHGCSAPLSPVLLWQFEGGIPGWGARCLCSWSPLMIACVWSLHVPLAVPSSMRWNATFCACCRARVCNKFPLLEVCFSRIGKKIQNVFWWCIVNILYLSFLFVSQCMHHICTWLAHCDFVYFIWLAPCTNTRIYSATL